VVLEMLLGELTLVLLHAGTPVALSQLTLNVMLVAFGISLMGMIFGRLMKTKDSLLQHRWTLTAAIILAFVAISLVMVPTAFSFYIDPDLEFFSSLSITTTIHGIVGFPAVVTALIYVFGDLPAKTKKWMRTTAILWIASLVLGVLLFLQMLSII